MFYFKEKIVSHNIQIFCSLYFCPEIPSEMLPLDIINRKYPNLFTLLVKITKSTQITIKIKTSESRGASSQRSQSPANLARNWGIPRHRGGESSEEGREPRTTLRSRRPREFEILTWFRFLNPFPIVKIRTKVLQVILALQLAL